MDEPDRTRRIRKKPAVPERAQRRVVDASRQSLPPRHDAHDDYFKDIQIGSLLRSRAGLTARRPLSPQRCVS